MTAHEVGDSVYRDHGLSPATAGCGLLVGGSWGSASLHPRLYAVARCRGLAGISSLQDFLCEVFLLNQTFAFFNRHHLIHADAGHGIDNAAGPTHLDEVDCGPLLEAEVQPQIILREVTAAAADLVYLGQAARGDLHARPDAVPITFHADRFHEHRVILIPTIVAQQLWRPIQIVDDNVNVTIVIDITKGGSAARTFFSQGAAALHGDFR